MTHTIRLAFLETTPPYDPASGGIATYIQHRACVLGRMGFEIWWVNARSVARWSPEEKSWVDRKSFPPSRIKARLFGRWPALTPAWEYLATQKQVEIFELQAGINSWLPFYPDGQRIVLHCHTSTMVRAFLNQDHDVERHTARFKVWASRNFRRAHGILAPSNEIAMFEAGYYRVHPNKITILPHVYAIAADAGLKLRNDTTSNGVFLVIGNVEYFKGLDLIASGFDHYLKGGGTGTLQVAGCGGLQELRNSSATIIKSTVEKVIAAHGPGKIQFLGKCSKDKLAQLRAQATAVICGSRFEAFTLVAGEAFLSGAPLILSNRTGWRALAERFHAARLINPYDAGDVGAAMREMENPEIRQNYRCGGDALAAYLQSAELAEKTAQFYRQLTQMNLEPPRNG